MTLEIRTNLRKTGVNAGTGTPSTCVRGTICRVILLILLLTGLQSVYAQNLEDEPEPDVGQADQGAAELSVEDLRKLVFTASEGEPVLDGRLDEDFWDQAQSMSIDRELYPERLAEAVVRTEGLVVFTDTHLYLGIRAYDPDPENIRSSARARDGVKEDDYVSLVIDATGNLRRKFEFRVNPHGGKADIMQDVISNRYWYDWDAEWRAKATITDWGWTAEMAIPFDSIKQPTYPLGERPTWVVLFKRSYPRAVDRTLGAIYLFQREAVYTREDRRRSLNLIPYYIFHPDEERDRGGDFVQVDEHENHEIGADIIYNISSGTSVFATLNPNYTEVEADIARDSINNPFVPFQPEKRAFFQEGRDLYSSFMPIVYTRNIIQPEYGGGFAHTGRKVSTGAFMISDEATKLVMPDNLGSDTVELIRPVRSSALRYAQGKKGSSYGLMATVRDGEGYENYVAGFDGLVNLGIDDKIRFQFMYASTEYPEDFADDLCEEPDCLEAPPPEDCVLGDCPVNAEVLRADPTRRLEGHGLRLSYKHDSPKSIYWLNYFDYDEDFRADFGFEQRVDYRQINAAYGRNWFVEALRRDRGLSRIRGYAVLNLIESASGEQIEDGLDFWGEFRGSFQSVLRAGYRFKERAVNRIQQDSLALGDNAPLFDESYLQWYFETAPTNNLVLNFDGRYGDLADADNLVLGRMQEFKPKITILTEKTKLSLSHTYRNFDYEGSELWQENFTTLQITYHPWDRHTFRFLVLNDETDRDAPRYVGDDPAFERERTAEFTYIYQRTKGLSILAGAKLKREDDSEGEDFTSGRQVYLKVQYNFDTDFPFTEPSS